MEFLSNPFSYSYDFTSNFKIDKCQAIVQSFYLTLASYELNIAEEKRQLPFMASFTALSLNPFKQSEAIPKPVAKLFRDSKLWRDYYDKGKISMKTGKEFNHQLFLPFFILESKLLSSLPDSRVSKHLDKYYMLMQTMIDDPDLTSFSLAVLYNVNSRELKLLYRLFDKLQLLLSHEMWSDDYDSALYLFEDIESGNFADYESSYDVNDFFLYPRARKAWLMYRLCIYPDNFKSYDHWVHHFKETYKWFMQQTEKVQKVLHPSRYYDDASIFFYEIDKKRDLMLLNRVLRVPYIVKLMMEFHLPRNFVTTFCNNAFQNALYRGYVSNPLDNFISKKNLLRPRGSEWYLPKIRKMTFNVLIGRNFSFDKSGRIKLVREYRSLNTYYSFNAKYDINTPYSLSGHNRTGTKKPKYITIIERVKDCTDKDYLNLLKYEAERVKITTEYNLDITPRTSPINEKTTPERFQIDERFLNHLLISKPTFFEWTAVLVRLNIQIITPVADSIIILKTLQHYFELVASHIEMIQSSPGSYRYEPLLKKNRNIRVTNKK